MLNQLFNLIFTSQSKIPDTSNLRGAGVSKADFVGQKKGLVQVVYSIGEELGRGTFGTVVAVQHRTTKPGRSLQNH